jgi:hypothetical protein
VENDLLAIDVISTNNIPINLKRQTTPTRVNTTICYPVVGCFDNNDPFNNAGLEVPQSPEFVSTAFLLFTQESPTNPEDLSYDHDDESLRNSNINSSRWLRILIHGFTNNRESVWMKKLKDGLLQLKNVRKFFYKKNIFDKICRMNYLMYSLLIGEMAQNFHYIQMLLQILVLSVNKLVYFYKSYNN